MLTRAGSVIASVLLIASLPLMAQEVSLQRPRILATIGDFNVTPSYFDRVVQNRFARAVLEDIIRTRIVADAAAAQGVWTSSDDVSAELARRASEFDAEGDLDKHIRAMGCTTKGYREAVQTDLLLNGLLNKAAGITDADVQAYFAERRGDYAAETELHLVTIATTTRSRADAAYGALVAGTPFDVVARRHGDPESAILSGDLGWSTRDAAPDSGLWAAAVELEEGDITGPLSLGGRYYILQLAGRRMADGEAMKAARPDIEAALRQQRGVNADGYVTALMAEAGITVPWGVVSYLEDEYRAFRSIQISVDGSPLSPSAGPHVGPSGVPMVPLRAVLTAVGATMVWLPDETRLNMKLGRATSSVSLGDTSATVNGSDVELPVAPLFRNDTLFAPAHEILEGLGVGVDWDPVDRTLSLTTPASD